MAVHKYVLVRLYNIKWRINEKVFGPRYRLSLWFLAGLANADQQTPGNARTCSHIQFQRCVVQLLQDAKDPTDNLCIDVAKAREQCTSEAARLFLTSVSDLNKVFMDGDVCTQMIAYE